MSDVHVIENVVTRTLISYMKVHGTTPNRTHLPDDIYYTQEMMLIYNIFCECVYKRGTVFKSPITKILFLVSIERANMNKSFIFIKSVPTIICGEQTKGIALLHTSMYLPPLHSTVQQGAN